MAVKSGVCIPREPSIDLVQVISEGTYTSFPQALKEFVSNAYDADATRVDLLVDEECNSIIVRDNGVGMTAKEFGDFFASIARTGKAGARSARGRTSLGRRKIGRFGIGSLAVVGAADNLVIRSVRRYTGRGFEASIDLRELRKHFGRGEDLSAHWRFGVREWSGERRSESFTEVVLEGLGPDIRSFLQRPGERTREEFFESTRQLSGVEELAWRLGVICPVAYEFSYPLRKEHLDRRRDAEMVENARELWPCPQERIQVEC